MPLPTPPEENREPTIQDFLSDPSILVKRHQVSENSEMTEMRSIAEIRALLQLGAVANCSTKRGSMQAIFAYRGRADNGCGGGCGCTFNNSRWCVTPRGTY